MENEQQFEMLIQLLGQIVTTAGAEWTAEFLQGGLEAAQQAGGGEQMPPDMPPEVMSQGGPGAMPAMQGGPPMAPKRGMMGKRIN